MRLVFILGLVVLAVIETSITITNTIIFSFNLLVTHLTGIECHLEDASKRRVHFTPFRNRHFALIDRQTLASAVAQIILCF